MKSYEGISGQKGDVTPTQITLSATIYRYSTKSRGILGGRNWVNDLYK
jgi:hypothetical protein